MRWRNSASLVGASLLNPPLPSPFLNPASSYFSACTALSVLFVFPRSADLSAPSHFPTLSRRFGRRESEGREGKSFRVREAAPLRSLRPVWRKGRTRDELSLSLSRRKNEGGYPLRVKVERFERGYCIEKRKECLLVLREFSKDDHMRSGGKERGRSTHMEKYCIGIYRKRDVGALFCLTIGKFQVHMSE